MNSIGQLWRTTTVRLTAIFVLIFVVFSVALLAVISWQSSIQLQRQQSAEIEREVRQITRIDRNQGWRRAAFEVGRLASAPGQGIYYLAAPNGQMMVSNIQEFPIEILQTPGVYTFDYERPRPLGAEEGEGPPPGYALVRSTILDSGMRLMIGRDVVERRGFTGIIVQGFGLGVLGIVLASVIAGLVTSVRVLRRIDAINGTAAKIISGNLSERVPVTRSNDEFDGLAKNLNLMLDRIEALLQGLKEVTDNVAHDLKTPLTRLRNKAEAALREGTGSETQREALETTLSESDKLIRTFNALLMIARAEAGAPSGAFADVDLSAVAADMAELYEPAAEDAGIALVTDVTAGITLRGNRELLGQALVNLLENALKYGAKGKIVLSVKAVADRIRIEVADNGPGIPEVDRERVVERFVRLEDSRTEPGSGLGLSLVAAVARLHRGEFRIEDNAPGVRAVMDLPRA